MNRKANQKETRVRHMLVSTLLAVGCLALVLCLSACSGGKEITLTIEDGKSETAVTANVGETVEEVLEEAEITVGTDDVVTPGLDYQIQEDDTTITIERYMEVTIHDGDDMQKVGLYGGTVQDALDKADIELGENDTVEPGADTSLTDGMEITVSRWHTVTLTIDGESEEVLTDAVTVQDLLDDQEIELGEEDEITPEPDTEIEDDMEIVIKRTTTEEVTETEEVPYETTYKDSSDLYEGETSVSQKGVNGEKEVTYKVTYENGEETGREKVSEEVTKEPVNEIILQGTKKHENTDTVSAADVSSDSSSSDSSNSSSGDSSNGSSDSSSGGSSGSSSGGSSSGSSGSSSGSSSGGSSNDNSGDSSGGDSGGSSGGVTEVSRQPVYDCDGSGGGYYIITYSDGSVKYEDF